MVKECSSDFCTDQLLASASPFSNQRNPTLFSVIACRITDKLLLFFWNSTGQKDYRNKAIQSAMPGKVLDSLRVTNWRLGFYLEHDICSKKPHHLEVYPDKSFQLFIYAMPGEENACLIWLGDTEAYQYNLTAKHRIYILPKTQVQKPNQKSVLHS